MQFGVTKLYIRQWGQDAKTAVLFHGILNHHANWRRLALAKRSFRVPAPKHGGRDKVRARSTLQNLRPLLDREPAN